MFILDFAYISRKYPSDPGLFASENKEISAPPPCWFLIGIYKFYESWSTETFRKLVFWGQFFNCYIFQETLWINSEHFDHRSADATMPFAPGSPICHPRSAYSYTAYQRWRINPIDPTVTESCPRGSFPEQKVASVSIMLLQDLTFLFLFCLCKVLIFNYAPPLSLGNKHRLPAVRWPWPHHNAKIFVEESCPSVQRTMKS